MHNAHMHGQPRNNRMRPPQATTVCRCRNTTCADCIHCIEVRSIATCEDRRLLVLDMDAECHRYGWKKNELCVVNAWVVVSFYIIEEKVSVHGVNGARFIGSMLRL